MAEFVFKRMLAKKGLEDKYFVSSAATSTEELGNPVYPPAKRILNKNGISCDGKFARQMTEDDYYKYDFIVCMDGRNLRNIKYIIGEDSENKVSLLLDYTAAPRDVSDPYFTGDFENVYNDILTGCEAFLEYLENL